VTRIARTEPEEDPMSEDSSANGLGEGLENLLEFIRDSRGFDFTGYKRSSLARRVRKRMGECGMTDYAAYRDLLEADAEEFRELFNTILINVTAFLRDTESWTFLQREVVPDLTTARSAQDEIRVWSAGCSSGEEAYSLAILFAEVLGIDECIRRLKIYGTDVDEEALREARAGVYSAKALDALSPQLRERYFEENGGRFAFRPDLRRRVIFGRHDITRDAPISRLDLLVCRNTLMYFNAEAQSQIVERFHFALRPGGHLFLGKAEMLLSETDRFDVESIRHRVFQRRAGEAGTPQGGTPLRLDAAMGQEVREASRKRTVRDLALESAPCAVIALDGPGTVVTFNAQARSLFGLSAQDLGRPFRDLEVSYRPIELRSLIEQSQDERRAVRVPSVERRGPTGEQQYLDVLVQPLSAGGGAPAGVMMAFTDCTLSTRLQAEVQRIRQDLETAYEALQSTNEELETTNEELQSSIEELETTNEELQSTNEELETTNEELESGNEELQTMNEELRVRTAELDEAHAFLSGVMASIGAGVVVLDSELRVRSWNRGAEDLWGLRFAEVEHQPFFSLDFGLPIARLQDVVELCRSTRRRTEPVQLDAVNRIGRAIVCAVACSPLDRLEGGVVLLMEELRKDG
jgi:two-component system CheB/CheR fusion protein